MTREEAKENLEWLLECSYVDSFEDAENEALRMAIKAIEKDPEWIPVDERLPERDVDVLAYVRGASFDYQRVMWIDDYSGKWVGYIGSGLYDKVIAWMPLPEPYTKIIMRR